YEERRGGFHPRPCGASSPQGAQELRRADVGTRAHDVDARARPTRRDVRQFRDDGRVGPGHVDATRAPGTPTSTTSLLPGTPCADAACDSARTTAGAVSGAQSAHTVVPAPDSAAPAAPAARASSSSAGNHGRRVARAGWWSRSL